MLRRRKRDEPQSKKPEDSDFKQQRLRAWEPLLTPFWVIVTFLSIGLIFLIIGIVALDASNSVVEVEKEYARDLSQFPTCSDAQPTGCCNVTAPGPECEHTVTMTIPDQMTPPIYVYYKLTDFYQNHRRYVKSRSDDQLAGDNNPDIAPCDPLKSIEGQILYPCGLIASSIYNDTLEPEQIVHDDGSPPTVIDDSFWTNKGIAWESDMDHKFKKRPLRNGETRDGPNGLLPEVDNEELAVWMRTAGLPTFKKLHRIINRESLKKGDQISFKVTDVFQVHGFGGKKALVISTASWLGGKNRVLSYSYLVVGIICFALGLIFLGLHIFNRRNLGDMKYWNWRS